MSLAICSLLLGAAVQILLARLCGPRVKGILATLACAPALLAVLDLLPAVQSGHAIDVTLAAAGTPLALVLHIDALSILFALMGVLLGACVLLYSIGYMAEDKAATRFYCIMLVFIAGFVALVSSANLLLLYLCWEVVGLCSFSLVGFWYTNPESVHGARKVLLMTHIAGYALLAAILVLYHRAGSMIWTEPAVQHAFTGGVFVLMLIALAAKSVQVPLHTWIPDAMAAPTPVSALLHAACYVTAGVYLAARMHSFAVWPQMWAGAMVWLGTLTMAIGVMYAMVQTDLKRMLAFSTVSQIGYMILGIGIGTPLAIIAGLLHCLTHGFFKGGLFLCAGSVQHAAGTRDMNQLGGLAERMPRTTLFWLIGAGSMMGIPLLSGFVSKWMIYAAALEAGWMVPALVAWIVSLGTVFLCAKATSAVFLGPATPQTEHAHEAASTMQWGMALLAVGNVALGVAPQLAVNTLLLPVTRALGLSEGMQVTWFGLSASGATFSTIGGLVLAIVSLIGGGIIYAFFYAARPVAASGAALVGAGSGIFTGGEPLHDESRLTVSDFADIFQHNWRDFFHWTNVDRVYLAAGRVLLRVSAAVARPVAWMERHVVALMVALVAVILPSIAWLATGAINVLPVSTHSEQIPLLLVASCGLAALALFVAAAAYSGTRRYSLLMILTAAAVVAGLLSTSSLQRLALIESGALLSALLVWRAAQSRAVRGAYLLVVVLSASASVAAQAFVASGQHAWAVALALTGICLKLAAIPFFFWLLRMADELPAAVLGLVIAVVDIAAFADFLPFAAAMPLTPRLTTALLITAALTSFFASLLMLAQRDLKRLLVLSTIEDIGFLLLGVAALGRLSTPLATSQVLDAVLVAAAAHALAKALLFICLAAPESDGALNANSTALATRYPLSAFGFLFGMLTMLGVPPTLGFFGRWPLYSAALIVSPWLLAVFIASSVCALAAYVLTLMRVWWGSPQGAAGQRTHEPFALRSAIVVLVLLVLGAGLWPGALAMLIGGQP